MHIKKGDKLLAVESCGPYLTKGRVYVAADDQHPHVAMVRVPMVRVPADDGRVWAFFTRRFAPVLTTPEPASKKASHEHVLESRLEVRLDQGFGYKAITRAPRTLKEAEEFVTRNAGNYAVPGSSGVASDGTFDIVQVEIIHREKKVRSVKRKHVPAHYELVDA